MATAAVNRSEIEKIVRKVLDEERPDGAAALKAIKRVSSLLTEEVIPNLPEKGHEGDDSGSGNEDNADADSPSQPRAFGVRSASAEDNEDTPDDDTGSDADDENAEVPGPVMQAFESLYHELSPEQATALASFFTALSEALKAHDGADEDEDSDTDTESGTDTDSDFEGRRPYSRAG